MDLIALGFRCLKMRHLWELPKLPPTKLMRGPTNADGRRLPWYLATTLSFQADYKCQGESDDRQLPMMHVFKHQHGRVLHFWGSELSSNHVDTVWPYWNLMVYAGGSAGDSHSATKFPV